MTLWETVAAERRALSADLSDLTTQQWQTESWCAGWSVRDVLAHMSSTAHSSPLRFVAGLAKARFSFDRFIDAGIANNLGASPADTLAGFVAIIDSTDSPPGPKTSWLGETIVHAEDIRRPLGITHTYPDDAVREVFDFYAGSNLIMGTKKRIDGLQLVASDTDFRHGAGGRVEGPLICLLLASTGRAPACDDLTGPGVNVLRARCLSAH
ncbi:MAG: maleylpyruvate isomerase family mycothiol-dependent enzyme [Actinomycetales bacterium]